MPRIRLTDPFLRTIEAPATGQVVYWDRTLPRFGLRVASGGSRAWVVRYKVRSRARWATLGQFGAQAPRLSLADARREARTLLARVTQGADPAAEKRAAREAPASEAPLTTDALIALYIDRYARGPGGEDKPHKRSWKEDERILAKYVPASWRSLPARTITRHQVRDAIEALAAHAPVMANRFRACFSKVFAFAVGRDLVPFNPVTGVERQRETPRTRAFTDAELQAIWREIEAEDVETSTIFKLALLLGARGGELRGLRREELDLDGAVWNVPAERTKTKVARRIVLGHAAVELLRALPARDGDYVFPGRRGGGRASIKDAQRRMVARSGVVGWTTHDLRAACGTGLALLGYPTDLIGRVLGHADRTITGRVYIRAANEGAIRAALDAWARRLHQIVTGEAAPKIVELRHR